MIRVMVVHPSPLINKATTHSLRQERGLRVIEQAFTAGEAQAKLSGDNCDVVVIAATLPDNGALTLTRMLYRNYPTLKPIVVGLPEEEAVVLDYVGAGAVAYVSESHSLTDLVSTIHAVVNQEAHVSPTILRALIRRVADLSLLCRPVRHNPAIYATLTNREQEIMGLLAQGWTNQTIAEHLSVEVGTVKNHVHRILKKLNVRNRQEVASLHNAMPGDGLALLSPA